MAKRVGGQIFVKADGVSFNAAGQFTYNINDVQQEAVIGHDGFHGIKAVPQELFIEGEFTDEFDLDLKNDLYSITDATITLELYSGKVISLEQAAFTGTGHVQTEAGNIAVKFTGAVGRELK